MISPGNISEKGTPSLMPRAIITLTTDFGHRDGYAGTLKGVILSLNPEATIVDITHDLEPHAVDEAARLLPLWVDYFPPGTVHLAVVDPGVGGDRAEIVIQWKGHFFVGPDNGIFSGIITSPGCWRAFRIADPRFLFSAPGLTFLGRDIFSPVAAFLSLGVDPREFGPRVFRLRKIPLAKPRHEKGSIHGQVIRTDRFGNLITNISLPDLETASGAGLQVQVGGFHVGRILPAYASVEPGRVLATIGGFGFLEIAVNQGRADEILNLGVGDQVVVKKMNKERKKRV